MSSIDHVKARELFAELLEESASVRTSRLRQYDRELAEFVARLLSRAGQMTRLDQADADSADPSDPDQLLGCDIEGRRIVGHLGDGGFGSVFVARDLEPLDRLVAVKILRIGIASALMPEVVDAEWRIPVRLNHPNIIGVHAVGWTGEAFPWAGRRRFIVSEFVDGRALTSHCVAEGSGITGRLGLFIEVCRAVQHLHSAGIIHGDLKPSNVLVDRHTGVVKVIDFGLSSESARASMKGSDPPLMVAGTMEYIAPERLTHAGRPPAVQDDVYALGVLLGDVVLAHPAFGSPGFTGRRLGEAAEELSESIRRDGLEPHLTRRDMTLFGRGLDDVFSRATSPDLEWRYRSAGELADDVRRVVEGRPVESREAELPHRFASAARRHPLSSLLMVLLLCVLVSGVLSTAIYAVKSDRNAGEARIETARARWELYVSVVQSTHSSLMRSDPQAASRSIVRAPFEHRDWEYRYLRYLTDSSQSRYESTDQVYSVRYDERGRLYAGGLSGFVAAFGGPGLADPVVAVPSGDAIGLAVSPGGRLLTMSSTGGTLRIATADHLELIGEHRLSDSDLLRTLFVDEHTIVVSTRDGWIHSYRLRPGETAVALDHRWSAEIGAAVYALAETGGSVWAGDDAGFLTRVGTERGLVLGRQRLSGGRVHDLESRSGGAALVAGTGRGELALLRVSPRDETKLFEVEFTLTLSEPITELALAHDQETVLFSMHGGRIGRFSIPRLELIEQRMGHTGRVYSIDAHPTEPVAATASTDGSVRLWRFGRLHTPARVLAAPIDPIGHLHRFGYEDALTRGELYRIALDAIRSHGDDRPPAWPAEISDEHLSMYCRNTASVVVGFRDQRSIAVVPLSPGAAPRFVDLIRIPVVCSISSDSSALAVVNTAGTIDVFDLESGVRRATRLRAGSEHIQPLISVSDGGVVVMDRQGEGCHWHGSEFRSLSLEFDGSYFQSIALSPSGERLIAGVRKAQADSVALRVYDTRNGRLIMSLATNLDPIAEIWFTEDGRELVVRTRAGARHYFSTGPS